ncbi:hypothetical protein HL42_5383 [Trichophyton rubrum]|nr:hypothetical protein HL42_5383 [Trichophyton rubrum]
MSTRNPCKPHPSSRPVYEARETITYVDNKDPQALLIIDDPQHASYTTPHLIAAISSLLLSSEVHKYLSKEFQDVIYQMGSIRVANTYKRME